MARTRITGARGRRAEGWDRNEKARSMTARDRHTKGERQGGLGDQRRELMEREPDEWEGPEQHQ